MSPHDTSKSNNRRKGIGERRKKKGNKSSAITVEAECQEIESLRLRIENEAPLPSTITLAPPSVSLRFDTLPLSSRTLEGLKGAGFSNMTPIQLAAIPHALAGRDVLAAAPTGSGKTASFLVPALETLYLDRWSRRDGLGVLVVSPTRELALQIFEVLRKLGKYHAFSAGLVTGGSRRPNDFKDEQANIQRGVNLLIATPGRLLQHLEQTPGFEPMTLQVLVLDEADRLLDMGFSEELTSILEYLPSKRQTLLFSATQTRSLKDLARLSLDGSTVQRIEVSDRMEGRGAGEDEEGGEGDERQRGGGGTVLPRHLVHNYVVCSLEDKLNVLLSFIKSHLKCKMIVFFASCSQVRFVHELLCQLRPGISILALHGRMKHIKRTAVYEEFGRKLKAILIATDIASRGLDFPGIDWVIQADAPEDAESYVHRVGRTARYKSGGRALTLLLPTEEEAVLKALSQYRNNSNNDGERKGMEGMYPSRLTINPKKMAQSGVVTRKAAAEVASDPELKRWAQKAFLSYITALHLIPMRDAFQIDKLPLGPFALSLGLAKAPRVPWMKRNVAASWNEVELKMGREAKRKQKNTNRSLERLKEQIRLEKANKRTASAASATATSGGITTPSTKMENNTDLISILDDAEDNEQLLVAKHLVLDDSKSNDSRNGDSLFTLKAIGTTTTSVKQTKKRLKQIGEGLVPSHSVKGRKTIFNSDGEEDENEEVRDHRIYEKEGSSTITTTNNNLDELAKQRVEQIKRRLQETDSLDKERARERVRLKHLKRRVGKTTNTATSSSAMDMLNQVSEECDGHYDNAVVNDNVVSSSSAPSSGVTSEDEYHVSRDMEDAVLRAIS